MKTTRRSPVLHFLPFLLISICITRIHATKKLNGARYLKRGRKHKHKRKETHILSACIGRYPGYEGDLNVSGMINVIFQKHITNSLVYEYMIEGVQPLCSGCGTHIHAGTTCDDADKVLGHHWDRAITADDPWGDFYDSDSNGYSKGSFLLYTGIGYEGNNGRAVVVHAQNGTRIGCGLLSPKVSEHGCL